MIPLELKEQLKQDPWYSKCARENKDCSGRITWEHCFLYGGKQIQRGWAIIPLCWFHHLGSGLKKEINEYISLRRATIDDFKEFPKKNFEQLKSYLIKKYAQN